MKIFLPILLSFTLVQATVFNLDQTIKFALSNSALILSAKEDLKISKAQTIESRSAALPTLQFISSGTKNYSIAGTPISFPTPQGVIDTTISFGRELQGVYGINIDQTLYDGRVISAIRAAKVFKKLTSATYDLQLHTVLKNTKIAFYTVLLSEKLTDVVSNSLERARNHLENTQLLFNSGNVSELDLIRAESSVAEQETQLATVIKNEAISLENLKLVIGYPLTDEFIVSGSFQENFEEILSYDELTQILLENQPAINQAQENYNLLTENVRSYYSEFMPSIVLSGSWQMFQMNDKEYFQYEDFQKNQSLSLNIIFPLFNGLGSIARLNKARANAKKAKYRAEDVQKTQRMELRKIHLTINETIGKINAGNKNLELAERGLEIAHDLYNKGMTRQLDLLDAELNYNQAELGLIQAIYEYHVTTALLSYITGKPIEELYK